MATYFFAPFIGSGTDEDAFRPDIDADSWSIIDFRPDPTVATGWCVVRAEGVTRVGSNVIELGESTDLGSTLPSPVRNQLKTRLGADIAQSSLDAILAELLIVWGEDGPGRTRWRPLKANRQGRHRIVMGGEVIYDAPAIQGATVTDDFNRANNDNIGSAWANDVAGYKILSNKLEIALGTGERIYYNTALDGVDQYAQVNVIDPPDVTTSDGYGVNCRVAGATNTYYEAVNRRASSALWIREVTAGVETTIASKTLLPTMPYTLEIEANGSTIRCLVDGVEQLSTTDTAIASGSYTGIRSFGAQGGAYDNFEAGDLAPSTTITLYAQLFQADETTSLSDEVQVGQVTADTAFTDATVTFTGLNTTADKTVWDAAKVRFRWATT